MGNYPSQALCIALCMSLPSGVFPDGPTTLYRHTTGVPLGARGWVAEFGRHSPGYLLDGFAGAPVILPAGTYQYTFYLQREAGHLRGLFSGANEAARLEIYDHTTGERIAERAFQQNDFDRPWKRSMAKHMIFSTAGRGGHAFEPRVYWPGLVSMRLARVELTTLDAWSESELAAKADRLERLMGERFIEAGFVVMRDASGHAEDLDDAALWTGLYAASQAWRYKATHSARARMRMETSLWALHRLHEYSPRQGTLARYVDAQNRPRPQPASKDTYTGFFFAVGQCWPWIQNPRLRVALRDDVDTLAGHFLDNDLRFIPAEGKPLNLNPYFSPDIFPDLFKELAEDAGLRRAIVLSLKMARRYFRLMGQKPPPSFARVEKMVRGHDSAGLERLFIPFLNDVLVALRLMEVNVGRSARPAERLKLPGSPYARLQDLLHIILERFGAPAKPIRSLEELKILPSQALLALHILRVAAVVMPRPNRYERYYEDNVWHGKELLRTCMNWAQWDELFAATLFGEAKTARVRGSSNHLPYLALWNLAALDPARRSEMLTLFERHRLFLHNDLNAMTDMMAGRLGLQPDATGMSYWILHRYPEARRGFGEDYWRKNGRILAAQFGGWTDGFARDPIPPDLRPRDAFLWQRNARSIRGDAAGWNYAPVDYLLVWWMSQAAKREAVSEKR